MNRNSYAGHWSVVGSKGQGTRADCLTRSLMIYKKKVKWSRYRPGVAQRVGRGIAVLFHGRGTRRGWVVSSTLRPHFTPGKYTVPILQEAGWAPGPVWTGGKSRPHRDSIPDRPAHSSVPISTELPGPPYDIYPSLNVIMFWWNSSCCVRINW